MHSTFRFSSLISCFFGSLSSLFSFAQMVILHRKASVSSMSRNWRRSEEQALPPRPFPTPTPTSEPAALPSRSQITLIWSAGTGKALCWFLGNLAISNDNALASAVTDPMKYLSPAATLILFPVWASHLSTSSKGLFVPL